MNRLNYVATPGATDAATAAGGWSCWLSPHPGGVRCLHSAGARHGERPSNPTTLRQAAAG